MKTLKARVEHGRMKLDVATKLPEGTVLELTIADPGDDLTATERRRLHQTLDAAVKSIDAGDVVPASRVLKRLRRHS